MQMLYEIVLHRSNWKTRQKFKGAFMETSERRATQRYRLNLAVVLRRAPKVSESDILNANTRNISTGGMYFTTDRHLAVNEVVDFSLTFAGLAEGTIVVVSGRARILRLETRRETISERVGIAAVIQDFQILRPDLVNQRN
jgi:PilZ domain